MSSTTSSTGVTASDAQKVAISIGVLLVFAFVMVEVAGTSKQAAVIIGLILACIVLLRTMSIGPTALNKLTSFPWIPGSTNG